MQIEAPKEGCDPPHTRPVTTFTLFFFLKVVREVDEARGRVPCHTTPYHTTPYCTPPYLTTLHYNIPHLPHSTIPHHIAYNTSYYASYTTPHTPHHTIPPTPQLHHTLRPTRLESSPQESAVSGTSLLNSLRQTPRPNHLARPPLTIRKL